MLLVTPIVLPADQDAILAPSRLVIGHIHVDEAVLDHELAGLLSLVEALRQVHYIFNVFRIWSSHNGLPVLVAHEGVFLKTRFHLFLHAHRLLRDQAAFGCPEAPGGG